VRGITDAPNDIRSARTAPTLVHEPMKDRSWYATNTNIVIATIAVYMIISHVYVANQYAILLPPLTIYKTHPKTPNFSDQATK
jgi:hypothetical protein